jgi:hypothetical protein
MAVFTGRTPPIESGQARFALRPGIAETRFYGWYDYQISVNDPFLSGQMYYGDRKEERSDLVFNVFTGVTARN